MAGSRLAIVAFHRKMPNARMNSREFGLYYYKLVGTPIVLPSYNLSEVTVWTPAGELVEY